MRQNKNGNLEELKSIKLNNEQTCKYYFLLLLGGGMACSYDESVNLVAHAVFLLVLARCQQSERVMLSAP